MSTLVSRHLPGRTRSKKFDGLIFTSDKKEVFCDLEFNTAAGASLDPLPLPVESKTATGLVVTKIRPRDSAIEWWFEEKEGGDVMVLALRRPGTKEIWTQLGRNPVYLGLDNEAYLALIASTAVCRDPDGRNEKAWLDEIAG